MEFPLISKGFSHVVGQDCVHNGGYSYQQALDI